MTLVAAAEMGRYGVTVNAIAPSARTRMTETVFAEMMATQDDDFDAMAPENISPLVVWLGSVESRDVTGKMFEVEGGIVRVAEGWAHGPQVDKGARWDPAELGPVVDRTVGQGAAAGAGLRRVGVSADCCVPSSAASAAAVVSLSPELRSLSASPVTSVVFVSSDWSPAPEVLAVLPGSTLLPSVRSVAPFDF